MIFFKKILIICTTISLLLLILDINSVLCNNVNKVDNNDNDDDYYDSDTNCIFAIVLYKLNSGNSIPILNLNNGESIISPLYPLQNLIWERVEPFTMDSIPSWEVNPVIFNSDSDDNELFKNGIVLNQGDRIMLSIALNCTGNNIEEINSIELVTDGTFNWII